ncbi:MAG: Rpn family recombination-promoting nuclease/putative transposase, partial [Bacillota bacterium]
MTVKQVNPLNDFIFKKLLGEEDSKDNLVAFLNAVLDPEDKKKLVSLEIVDNKQLTKELIEDKTGRLDVRAKTADGTQVNIEVQLTNQYNMDNAIKKTYEKLEYLKNDETAMALYEARQNSLHERANMISTAKAQGKAESKKETAIAAFRKGLSIEIISD